jgi:hypothetical protein
MIYPLARHRSTRSEQDGETPARGHPARRVAPEFGPCDSLVFLVLWYFGGRAAALTDILSWYDWLDRSIPTAAQLDGALNRLLAAGLVAQRRGKFSVPKKIVRAYATFRRRRRRSRFTMAARFVDLFGPLRAVPRRVTIRIADHAQAYAEYHQRFEEAWAKVSGARS